MKFQSNLLFNTRKIYLFGVIIALFYGLSPAVSILFFDSDVSNIVTYQIYYFICLVPFLVITFPCNRRFECGILVDEFRLVMGLVLAALGFVVVQVALYGDFTSAFIVPYTERAGAEFSGGIKFIFYPMTTIFIALVFLMSTHLYARRDRINIINLVVLITSVMLIAALGSRNLLLWGFSATLALVISKLRYRYLLAFMFSLYIFAVLFAYARNNGLVAYLAGNIDQLYDQLSWAYFDPLIHEFGSSYRTFDIVTGTTEVEAVLANVPYGQFSSFFINLLPSFVKPSDFISFTDSISLIFAKEGEGIGSSPMTEAYLSDMGSLLTLIVVLALVYWPAYYQRRLAALSFFTYGLAVAVAFNIWRIGSAEILKMFASNVFALLVLAKLLKFRVLYFRKVD